MWMVVVGGIMLSVLFIALVSRPKYATPRIRSTPSYNTRHSRRVSRSGGLGKHTNKYPSNNIYYDNRQQREYRPTRSGPLGVHYNEAKRSPHNYRNMSMPTYRQSEDYERIQSRGVERNQSNSNRVHLQYHNSKNQQINTLSPTRGQRPSGMSSFK